MARIDIIGDLEDDPAGNLWHIAEHGISPDEVAEVLENPAGQETSHSSGRPILFGYTSAGRLLVVIYEPVEKGVVYPVTAYEVEE